MVDNWTREARLGLWSVIRLIKIDSRILARGIACLVEKESPHVLCLMFVALLPGLRSLGVVDVLEVSFNG